MIQTNTYTPQDVDLGDFSKGGSSRAGEYTGYSHTTRIRESVSELVPQDLRNALYSSRPNRNANRALFQTFHRAVLQHADAGRRADAERGGNRMELGIAEAWQRGAIKISDVDFGEFIGDVARYVFKRKAQGLRVPDGVSASNRYGGLREMFKRLKDDNFWKSGHTTDTKKISEAITDAVMNSQFARYMDTAIRLGTLEMCGSPDVAPILALLGRVNVGSGQTTLATDPVLTDISEMIGDMAENEQTPFFGIGDPLEVTLPKRTKVKYAYAIGRSDLGFGVDEAVRRVMANGASMLDEYWAPHILRLLFDNFATPGDNPYPFVMDGAKYRSYYAPRAVDFETYWENLIYNNDQDFVPGDRSIFLAIEKLFDNLSDPRTGRPMDCCDTKSIIGTGRHQNEVIREALGAVTVSSAVGGLGNAVVEFPRGGRDGWNPNTTYSLWVNRILKDQIAKLHPSWTRAQVEQSLERTILTGCPDRAFIMQVEWERETLEREAPNTWEYFDREIIWARKYIEKAGLATVMPWAVTLVKGLPQGVAAPAPPTPVTFN